MSTLKVATVQNTGSGSMVFRDSSNNEVGNLVSKSVKFNGEATGTIQHDKGISSVTDNGTGDYTVNFDNAFSNDDYAYVFGAMNKSGTSSSSTTDDKNEGGDLRAKHDAVATGTFRVQSWRHTNTSGESANDVAEICIFFIGS